MAPKPMRCGCQSCLVASRSINSLHRAPLRLQHAYLSSEQTVPTTAIWGDSLHFSAFGTKSVCESISGGRVLLLRNCDLFDFMSHRRGVCWLSLVTVTSALTQVKSWTESHTSNVSLCACFFFFLKSPQFDLFEQMSAAHPVSVGSGLCGLERRKHP